MNTQTGARRALHPTDLPLLPPPAALASRPVRAALAAPPLPPDAVHGALHAAQQAAWGRCAADPAHFLRRHTQVENPAAGGWVPFDLWPAQAAALAVLEARQRVVVLKARQLGLTWLCLGYALWRLLFHPGAAVLLFSLNERTARELADRLRGM